MPQTFVLPRQVALDDDANPLAGALLYFFQTGTTTPQAVYSDITLTTPHANPVVADASGEWPKIYLDSAAAVDYRVRVTTSDGVQLYQEDNIERFTVSGVEVGRALYPRTSAEQSAGVTPTNYSYPSDTAGEINIKRFGAASTQTAPQNKAHIQTAISVADAKGSGCVIVIPHDCPYGYVATTRATHPDFTGVTRDMLVVDYTPGSSYVSPARDGMQARYFFHTPQTSPVGQHDGNGQWIRGNWHPYLTVSNDGGPQSPRTADDNRRASIVFARDGEMTWRIGQSTLSSASATDNELSNLGIDIFNSPLGDVTALIVSFITGNWLFNTGSNTESASYHFKSRSTGYVNCILESLTTETRLLLRNSDGSTDDVEIQNNDGALEFHIGSQGDAISIAKADRAVTLSTILKLGTAPQVLTGAGAVNLTTSVTHLVTTGANALTLADGAEGQIKFIVMKTDGGAGTLTPTSLYNGTTLTFDDVGDSAHLLFTDGQWVFMGGTATLA